MDALAGTKVEAPAANRDRLRNAADQMHLDPALARIIDCLVAKRGKIYVAAKLSIDSGQDVEIECGRNASSIVVGLHQRLGIFLEIDANKQPAIGAKNVAEFSKQVHGLFGRPVPDR